MLTKIEFDNLTSLLCKIKDEKTLDQCIDVLSNNEIINCSLHFTGKNLPISKIIELKLCLASQKKLITLSLTADLGIESAEEIASCLGSVLESLQHSLKSLTLRGLYAENTTEYLAQLISNSNLLVLSVGAYYKGQKYIGINKSAENQIIEAFRTNNSLSVLDLSLNTISSIGVVTFLNTLSYLQKIDLRGNGLIFHSSSDNFARNTRIPHLIEIYLDKTIFSPTKIKRHIYYRADLEQVLDFIKKSTNLSTLILTFHIDDQLLNEYLPQLRSTLEQKKNLQSLRLYKKNWNSDLNLLFELSEVIKNHLSLENLEIRMYDYLNQEAIDTLATIINSNSKLTSISIGPFGNFDNFVELTSFSSIFKALEQNTNLTHVDLSNNLFLSGEYDASEIAAMLKINKSLRSLCLNNIFRNKNRAVQIILSALAENQTLVSLNLEANNSYLSYAVINQLKKNRSLIQLHLSNLKAIERMKNLEKLPFFEYSNDISNRILSGIEKIIERNINLNIQSLYQSYLFLTNNNFPNDLIRSIFLMVMAKFGSKELKILSKTPFFENREYLNPPVVEELEEIEDKKIDYFKVIYKALYEGQSSRFKNWNKLVDKVNLSQADIEKYIRKNDNSRTEKAWQLANDYDFDQDFRKLFKQVHQISFENSSNFFGFFKQNLTFEDGYKDLENKIIHAKPGSRTKIINEIFDLGSIKP